MTEREGQDPQAGTEQEDEGGTGLDTGTQNDDLHGQAREVAESADEPGAAETPAG